ncbi:hypothetical protein D3C72_1341660 [compost metagenome]
MQAGQAAHRQRLVGLRAFELPGDLFVAEFAPHLGRDARRERTRGHLHAGGHEGAGRDDGFLAHLGLVHHHRVHAHQRVAPHDAAVQDRAVADVAVDLHHRVVVGKAVDAAVVLHVGAFLQDDAAEVSAQAGAGADITVGADDHVADQHGCGMHVGARVDDRNHAVDGIAGHSVSLFFRGLLGHAGFIHTFLGFALNAPRLCRNRGRS